MRPCTFEGRMTGRCCRVHNSVSVPDCYPAKSEQIDGRHSPTEHKIKSRGEGALPLNAENVAQVFGCTFGPTQTPTRLTFTRALREANDVEVSGCFECPCV